MSYNGYTRRGDLFPVHETRIRSIGILSNSEKEIAKLVGYGFTNAEIAGKLNIKCTTLRNYVSKIFHKTGVTNRTELALYAIRRGLVELDFVKKTATQGYLPIDHQG
jgi:DNA-binding NarL/FixJ family response regulator